MALCIVLEGRAESWGERYPELASCIAKPGVTTTKRGLEEEKTGRKWWYLCHPRTTNGHKSVGRVAKKLSEVDLVSCSNKAWGWGPSYILLLSYKLRRLDAQVQDSSMAGLWCGPFLSVSSYSKNRPRESSGLSLQGCESPSEGFIFTT